MYTHLQLSSRLSKSSVVLKEYVKVELSSFLLQDKILENSSCYLKAPPPYLGSFPFNMITKHDANLFMVAHASTFCFFCQRITMVVCFLTTNYALFTVLKVASCQFIFPPHFTSFCAKSYRNHQLHAVTD